MEFLCTNIPMLGMALAYTWKLEYFLHSQKILTIQQG